MYLGVVPRVQSKLSRALHAHRGKKLLHDLQTQESAAKKRAIVRFRGAREKTSTTTLDSRIRHFYSTLPSSALAPAPIWGMQHAMKENTSPTRSSGRKTSIGARSPILLPSFLSLCRHVVTLAQTCMPSSRSSPSDGYSTGRRHTPTNPNIWRKGQK